MINKTPLARIDELNKIVDTQRAPASIMKWMMEPNLIPLLMKGASLDGVEMKLSKSDNIKEIAVQKFINHYGRERIGDVWSTVETLQLESSFSLLVASGVKKKPLASINEKEDIV